MSWIQKLYETYQRCHGQRQFDKDPLNPVSFTYQDTQIQVTIDGDGNFRRAEASELPNTVIPVSEESASRSGKTPRANPLTEKLKYCGADIGEYGGDNKRYKGYRKELSAWCSSPFADPKACAVLRYVEKKTLIGDLIREKVLKHENGNLGRLKIRPKHTIDADEAWVRWRVEIPGAPGANTWEDEGLFRRWTSFENSGPHESGVCAVAGDTTRIARLHPRGIRNNSDGAKLISSNDDRGFTYRGRFSVADQAATVGYEVTQKAHNALRWLIKRQGARVADQVFVAWSVAGIDIPDPLADTAALFDTAPPKDNEQDVVYAGDAGQHFALRLNKAISGYRARLRDTAEVVVMGLDSATPGRMAITYYRELTGSEFLERICDWHAKCSWFQNYSRDQQFVGAPAPRDIAEAAYGRRVDDNLRKSTVARMLPCIVDARQIPRDLVLAVAHRAAKRFSLEKEKGRETEWEKCLGIACALIRGSSKEENYQMSLEENRNTRDYLFGRLLAIADNIERRALSLADENSPTTAERLMQRFADHPCSTWKTIELALAPYKARLRNSRPPVLLERDKLLDAVFGMFEGEDFTIDSKLSSEFLLGYHCQRAALRSGRRRDGSSDQHEPPTDGKTEGENHEHSSKQN